MSERLSDVLSVLLLSFEYPPRAGAGTHVHELSMGLSRRGCRVTLLAPTIDGPRTYDEGNSKVHLVAPSAATCAAVSKLSNAQGVLALHQDLIAYGEELIDQEYPLFDIIHCHDWYMYGVAHELKQASGIPIVGTAHSTSEPITKWWDGTPSEEVLREEKAFYRNADALITVSASMASLICCSHGVSQERVHAIHNGFDANTFLTPRLTLQQRQTLRRTIAGPEEKIILFAGRLTPQKGISALYKAAAVVVAQNPRVRYLLAGEPDSLQSAEMVSELRRQYPQLEDKVTLLGKVARSQLGLLYQVADLALVPSVYEPFGYAATEAMAAGVPVVATRVGGLAEIIEHERSGLLVSVRGPEDGMHEVDVEELAAAQLKLLNDEALAERLGAEGQKRVQTTFTPEQMIEKTLAVYHRTCALRTSSQSGCISSL